MSMKKLALIGVALAALSGCDKKPAGDTAVANATTGASTTTAAPPPASTPTRVRGVLQAVTPNALTVRTYDGRTVTTPLDAKTGFAWVVGSDLSAVKTGDFIGTATTGPDDALRAVEVVIFPEAMRGTGEGHYAWDVPGAVASKGGVQSGSSAMTNGAVQQQSAMTNGAVQSQSAMTNGSVTGGAGKPGEKKLTISYKGGTSQVLVPAGAPIVRFEPAQRTVLAKGQKVFIVPGPDGGVAKFVAIGKDGITPPM